MNKQLELFIEEGAVKFVEYHIENPGIWEAFKTKTLETIEKGFQHYGAKGIFEIIRWQTGTSGNDGFKVNNNYTPFYARLFEMEFPKHKGFFQKRGSKYDLNFQNQITA